jgi:Zn-dependent M16 (insulinase) family peptidase
LFQLIVFEEELMFGWRLPGMLAACITAMLSSQAQSSIDVANLEPKQKIADFQVENVYENELGRTIGARFKHVPSGFVLDLLRIQSLPQAFMWVNSFPPSDQGEPHTCEHLMLGKGARGRYVGSLEEMSLGNSSAFTGQLQTCYHFHTAAGTDVFFELMEAKLEALIHPDFSDEEIRREVCNMGYTIDQVDSTIHLEEKGTVYNEMVSSFERPWGNLGRQLGQLLYGPNHPLSYESGGYPAAIRTMKPEDMRAFIAQNYHLSNMGMIISLDNDIELDTCLERISFILKKVEPDVKPGADPAIADENLPAPKSAPVGAIKIVSFPSQNEKEPGLLIYAWPPVFEYTNEDGYILDLLMSNFASGETSDLFRKIIDSQTREINIGANAVFEWVSADEGNPIYIGFNNVRQEACNEAVIDTVRHIMLQELAKIAAYPDNSPELAAFNERAMNRVMEQRRDLRNFLNTPPGFGYRGTSSRWLDHLKHLQKTNEFRKRLTLDSELSYAEQKISTHKNFWKDYINKWKLLETKPYGVASTPSPLVQQQIDRDRNERITEYVKKLEKQYGTTDENKAIARFKNDYDAKSLQIDSAAVTIAMPKFVDNPPLTLDDHLQYAVGKLPGGGTLVNTTFENMTSSTVGLAFRMDVVPESLLLYTAALPILLTEVGVTKDGRTYQYDEMKEAIRREILDLRSYYSVSYRTGRVELVMRGSGSNIEETRQALGWMEAALFQPLWTEKNLPRLRDAIDLYLSDLRNTMRAPEENWVDDPANAYWRQSDPLLLYSSSFLTQAHALMRLRWLLKSADSDTTLAGFSFLMHGIAAYGEQATKDELSDLLSILTGDRISPRTPSVELDTILAHYRILPAPCQALILDAAEDLKLTLADLPEQSLADDWRYLCSRIEVDLRVPPEKTLADLNLMMDLIRRNDNVRGFMIGNSADQKNLMPKIDSILSRLSITPSEYQVYSDEPIIKSRLKERFPASENPLFVGLINENTRMGVFLNSAPCASFNDTDPELLLQFLSARLYGGGGAHSMFMKTWSAGLAYSNGLRSNEFTGRLIYYAERCPDLSQTMQFVVNELKNAPSDSTLAEYAVAQAFSMYRSGSRYESRGEAIAADLADSLPPEKVTRFRQGILELRKDPKLYDKLQARMEEVYGRVLPGYGPTADKVKDPIYFIIGPESQFRTYEEYLHSVEGNFTLYRLYPRDFWIVPKIHSVLKPPVQ